MPGPILMLTPPSVAVAAQGSSQQSQSPISSLQDQVVTAVREPQPRSMYNEIIQLVGINLVSAMTERIAELELRCNELEREKEAKLETVIVTESRLVRSAHCDTLEMNTKDNTEAKFEANPMDGIPYEAILHQLAIVDVLLDGAIHCYDKLEQRLRDLRQRRNAFSAIHNLPSDILSLVFAEYKLETGFNAARGSWVNILGICARWREIVLHTPAFWATISVADPHLPEWIIDAMDIQRSIISTNVTNRLEEIHLRIDADSHILHDWFQYSQWQILDPLPMLRLEYMPSSRGRSTAVEDFPWDRMRSLSSLILVNVAILTDADAPMATSLVNLTISFQCPGISVTDLLDFLRHTPNLRNATIGTISRDAISSASTPVVLSSLESLHIFPCSARIHATFPFSSQYEVDPRYITTLRQLCSHVASTNSSTPIQKMNVVLNCDSSRYLRLHWPGERDPFLLLNLPSLSVTIKEYFDLCSSSIPLDRVVEFSIDDTRRTMVNTTLMWSKMLPSLTSLKALTIATSDILSLPLILRGSPAQPNGGSINNPDLEVITVNSTAWPSLGIRPELAGFFTKRRDMGMPIRKLAIRDCTITSGEVESLREFVTVDWDGLEMTKE
ncbi:hypothetical protein ONZ45_g17685 [Pleurotus djamor]|nr:hypothetical protein ONZ45_g17685 [Pleurotus djamor]